jgi:transposase
LSPQGGQGCDWLRTDKIDAQLLAAGFLAEAWTPDAETRVRRRLLSRRCHLVRQRVREKNPVHAVLQRGLKEHPPIEGKRAERWR